MQGSLENARARIRVLEGERDALRARVEAAEAEVSDLKMSLKLTEERAAQAEETAAKEIAVAMEAVNRVHTAEDALGEFSAEAEAERAKAVDAKSAMKSRAGRQVARAQDRVERAESDRDAAVERAKTAEEARFKAESELERSRSSPAGKDLADARRRLRQAETARVWTPRKNYPTFATPPSPVVARRARRYHHLSLVLARASPTRPRARDSVSPDPTRPPAPRAAFAEARARPAFEPNSNRARHPCERPSVDPKRTI